MNRQVTISNQDFQNSGKSFSDTLSCPATVMIRREFGFWGTVNDYKVHDFEKGVVGKSSNKWDEKQYANVATGGFFETEITIFEPVKPEAIRPRS